MKKTPLIFTLAFMALLLGIAVKSSTIPGVKSSTATIYVNPQTTVGTPGQNFTVNIEISDVVDLYGWEFRLGWDSTILEALNVVEGPFLKQGGDTFFCSKINNTAGYMIVDCTLLGNVPGVSGNGTLAIVEFYVETFGECTLDLYDTILVSSAEQSIEHTVIDGYFYTVVRDVAVVNFAASETTVNVTVKNNGNYYTETFNVSVWYTLLTDPLIGTKTITLEPGANATLVFTWTPTYGRYEIRAEASEVPNEADIINNVRVITVYIGSGSSGGGSGVSGWRRAVR